RFSRDWSSDVCSSDLGTVKGMDLRQIKVDEDDFGLMSFDPAYTNTASCRSAITYIDGEAGVLEYRGYPIEQLCEQATNLEVAYRSEERRVGKECGARR